MVNKIEAYIVDLLDLFQQWHSFASEVDLRGNLSSRSELGRESLGWLARKKSLGWLASRRSRTWLCPPRSHLVGFDPIRSGDVCPEGRDAEPGGQHHRGWKTEPQRLKDSTRKSRISGENLQKILKMDRKSLVWIATRIWKWRKTRAGTCPPRRDPAVTGQDPRTRRMTLGLSIEPL